jgi:hypothetical protein
MWDIRIFIRMKWRVASESYLTDSEGGKARIPQGLKPFSLGCFMSELKLRPPKNHSNCHCGEARNLS